MKKTDRPVIEWLLLAALASVLAWRIYADFTQPLAFGADRWVYVIPHLHIYCGLLFATAMIATRAGRKWFAFLLVAACFWVFPVAYANYGLMVKARDSISSRSVAERLERRFWIKAARDVAMAMAIAALGVAMIVKERPAQPGATDNPDDAQRI